MGLGPSSQPWQKPREKERANWSTSLGVDAADGDGAAWRLERVDRAAIVARGRGHVLGRLEPPFDLEGGDAGGDQLRHQIVGGEVLRRERILPAGPVQIVAVADQV